MKCLFLEMQKGSLHREGKQYLVDYTVKDEIIRIFSASRIFIIDLRK